MKRFEQKGFAHLALLIVIVVVAAVAVVGMRVVDSHNNTSVTPAAATRNVPTKLSNKADLNNAAKTLNATSVDSSVDPDQLDQDLNSLL